MPVPENVDFAMSRIILEFLSWRKKKKMVVCMCDLPCLLNGLALNGVFALSTGCCEVNTIEDMR